jgi:hypothetical protein
MPRRDEYAPGDDAPAGGTYEQLNVFGRPNGVRVMVNDGHLLPHAPRGHTWRLAQDDEAHC